MISRTRGNDILTIRKEPKVASYPLFAVNHVAHKVTNSKKGGQYTDDRVMLCDGLFIVAAANSSGAIAMVRNIMGVHYKSSKVEKISDISSYTAPHMILEWWRMVPGQPFNRAAFNDMQRQMFAIMEMESEGELNAELVAE